MSYNVTAEIYSIDDFCMVFYTMYVYLARLQLFTTISKAISLPIISKYGTYFNFMLWGIYHDIMRTMVFFLMISWGIPQNIITIRSMTCFSYILLISLDQNGQLLNKWAKFFLTILLDLTKSSEVKKVGDRS